MQKENSWSCSWAGNLIGFLHDIPSWQLIRFTFSQVALPYSPNRGDPSVPTGTVVGVGNHDVLAPTAQETDLAALNIPYTSNFRSKFWKILKIIYSHRRFSSGQYRPKGTVRWSRSAGWWTRWKWYLTQAPSTQTHRHSCACIVDCVVLLDSVSSSVRLPPLYCMRFL